MGRAALSLGLDIGGTKTRGVLVTPELSVVADAIVQTSPGAEGLRETVEAVVERLAATAVTTPAEFGSIGVGLPGIVDPSRGVLIRSVNLGIEDSDIDGVLCGMFTAPVRVENDVKAAAIGARAILGERANELCYLNVGTGLSAGFVSGGRLVRGGHNGAGELGHFSIDPAGEPCLCGQRGCLETIAGGASIRRRLTNIGANLGQLPTNSDPRAQAELRKIRDAITTVVCLILSAYEPGILVMGGGVLANAPWLRSAVAAELARRARKSPFLALLAPTERLVEIAAHAPVAALGAAVIGRS